MISKNYFHRSYFSEPLHNRLQQHYVQSCHGGGILVFTEAFKEEVLRDNDYGNNHIQITLLDTTDQKRYTMALYLAYQNKGMEFEVMDDDWQPHRLLGLSDYFYCQHHCPCHRKTDAKRAGADTDEECEGNRFLIEKIVFPEWPELILFSETMDETDLEASLEEHRKLRG